MGAKVSFDFDGVLSRPVVQALAAELLAAGHDVWVVTMRYASARDMAQGEADCAAVWEGNDDLFAVVDRLGIPRENVIFTNYDWKTAAIARQAFVWHLDDCAETLQHLQAHCRTTRAISAWNTSGWRNKCLKLIAYPADRAREPCP